MDRLIPTPEQFQLCCAVHPNSTQLISMFKLAFMNMEYLRENYAAEQQRNQQLKKNLDACLKDMEEWRQAKMNFRNQEEKMQEDAADVEEQVNKDVAQQEEGEVKQIEEFELQELDGEFEVDFEGFDLQDDLQFLLDVEYTVAPHK